MFSLSSLNGTLVHLFARNVLEEAALRSGMGEGALLYDHLLSSSQGLTERVLQDEDNVTV